MDFLSVHAMPRIAIQSLRISSRYLLIDMNLSRKTFWQEVMSLFAEVNLHLKKAHYRCNRNPTEENKIYKKQRKEYFSLRKKSVKQYFPNIANNGNIFLNCDAMFKDDREIIICNRKLAKNVILHCINNTERSNGRKPVKTTF